MIYLFGGSGRIGAPILSTFKEDEAISLDIKESKSDHPFLQCNVTVPNDVMNAFAHMEKHDDIHIINATYPMVPGIGAKNQMDLSPSLISEFLDVHLISSIHIMQQAVKLAERGRAVNLIQVSSIYGNVVPDFDIYADEDFTTPLAYVAAKAAQNQLIKYFAKYAKNQNFRANAICYGGIYDGHSDNFRDAYNSKCSGRQGMLEPKNCAPIVHYLVGDPFINGQVINIDSGFGIK